MLALAMRLYLMQSGFYVLRIFEEYSAGYSILVAVLCEAVIVAWIYGKITIYF